MFKNGTTEATTTRLDSPAVTYGTWTGEHKGQTRTIDADRLYARIRHSLDDRRYDTGHVLSIAWTLWHESDCRFGATLLLRFALGAYWREVADGRPDDEVPDRVAAKRRKRPTLRHRRFIVDAFAEPKERELIGTLLQCGGSYTAAAKMLGVSQPAVSQRVKRLETRYVLAEVCQYVPERRSLRRVRLATEPIRTQEERTEAGRIAREAFHREAGTIARRVRNARKAASTFPKRPSGLETFVIAGCVYIGRKAD